MKTKYTTLLSLSAAAVLAACVGGNNSEQSAAKPAIIEEPPIKTDKPCFSGVYPHMAFWSAEGECGTGAVVPWAGKLWAITYGPHCVFTSTDKLYEISPNLDVKIRPESLGGTHANRMIHRLLRNRRKRQRPPDFPKGDGGQTHGQCALDYRPRK